MGRADAEALIEVLGAAWRSQYGAIGPLSADIDAMYKRAFRPIAREATVRKAIERDVQAAATEDLPSELCVTVGTGQLISPEGRVALDVLGAAVKGPGDVIELAPETVAAAEHFLLGTYRRWARERLVKVAALTAGAHAPLLPAPIALVLTLLIEGAIGPTRAITQRRDASDHSAEQPIIEAIAAFSQALDPDADWDKQHFGLYRGYALSEARRRLPSLTLEPDYQRRGADAPPKKLYINDGADAAVLRFIAHELVRRRYTAAEVERAFDAMCAAHASTAGQPRAERAARRAAPLRQDLLDEMDAFRDE